VNFETKLTNFQEPSGTLNYIDISMIKQMFIIPMSTCSGSAYLPRTD